MEIKPRGKSDIKVTILFDGAPGPAKKTVEVWSNDSNTGMVTLVTEGTVTD
ncbi:hypothetical protein E2O03_002065 [Candidatus Magnetomonas plexicatena]|nr:hypothetical protein E2O03_002065 [Nitrospirales bacterium LBB_01]